MLRRKNEIGSMWDWLYRHRLGTIIAILLVLPLFMMYFHGRRSGDSFIEKASIALAGRLQSLTTSITARVFGLVQSYLWLVDVQEQNAKLREENERLLAEALEAKQLSFVNGELRRLLDLKRSHEELRMIPAVIVGREVTPFFRVNRVKIESEDVILQPDMAVVTYQGVLGRTISGGTKFADVMLLTDSRSRVACEVLGRGILGMLVGSGALDVYQARLLVSLTEVPLEAGAVIVTSGHDRVFPRGIEVGYILDPSRRRLAGQFVEYEVALAVNPAAVSHVMVVVGTKER